MTELGKVVLKQLKQTLADWSVGGVTRRDGLWEFSIRPNIRFSINVPDSAMEEDVKLAIGQQMGLALTRPKRRGQSA